MLKLNIFDLLKNWELHYYNFLLLQRDPSPRSSSEWTVGIWRRYSWPAARCVSQSSYDWENSDRRPPVARWETSTPMILGPDRTRSKIDAYLFFYFFILFFYFADTNFVLANYKTDQCTKPPRLCRQGYACPHYHNSRDRRRNPRKFKYR